MCSIPGSENPERTADLQSNTHEKDRQIILGKLKKGSLLNGIFECHPTSINADEISTIFRSVGDDEKYSSVAFLVEKKKDRWIGISYSPRFDVSQEQMVGIITTKNRGKWPNLYVTRITK